MSSLISAYAEEAVHVHTERLAELSSMVERLGRVIRPSYIPAWMNKPVELLDDDKPGEHRVGGVVPASGGARNSTVGASAS